MIPKVIHYCWFGGNPLPEEAKRCIESWKKYCPNYKIIEWNENNYDVNSNEYMKAAYKEKNGLLYLIMPELMSCISTVAYIWTLMLS